MNKNNFFDSSDLNNEGNYTFHEILYVLKKHIKIILAVSFIVLLYTIYKTFNSPYIYRSSSTILINEDASSRSFLDMGLNANRNYIDNEMAILGSRTTSVQTIMKLYDADYKEGLYLLGTKKKTPSILGKIFKSSPNSNNDSLDSIVKINKYSNKLRRSILFSNDKKTDAIIISIESPDPDEAALIINTLVDVYVERDLLWATGEMNHLKVFLYDQLVKKEIELNKIEDELREFQEREKIFGLDENSSIILENLTQFETEYNNILASISIIEEKEKYLTNQLTVDEKELSKRVSSTTNERLLALKNEMSILEGELISTITKYGDNHSAVIDLKNKLSKVKNKIEGETKVLIADGISVADPIMYRQSLMDSVISIQAIKANLLSKSGAYTKLVNEYENKLSLLPEKFLEYTRLERARAIHAETYSFMSQKLEEAKIGEASKISKVRIIDKAIANPIPIKPNKRLNLILGCFLGLLFGVSIAMIIELFDNTINSIEQLERRGLEILAMIPSIALHKNKVKNKRYLSKDKNVGKLKRRLITHEDPKSPISEAYRSLRTSLMYKKKTDKTNMMLVSSPGPGEGKTTTIANLAITYANLGKKTILIDSDLRKPVIHKVFNFDKTPGLTSFLTENSSLDKITHKSNIDNLDIISSGIVPPNPSELLDSNRMDELFKKLKEKYDVILFDSPPLVAVTDAFVLLKHIDQFILVVRAGVTERGALKRIMTSLAHTKFKIEGVVMNAITEQNSYGSGYYYNYYQYYSETEK